MHPEEFKIQWKAFYERAEELTAAARKALPHELNIAYGADVKQRLDVYQPPKNPGGAPVFLFLHGGGFREGDRAQYGYVAKPLADRGIVTVVASYRLMPKAHYPEQPQDVAHAIQWIHRNIKKYGGDANAIFVGGHSAGAILTADVSVKDTWQQKLSLPADVIKGCVPISAPYNLMEEKGVTDYILDPKLRAEASPVLQVKAPPAQCLVAVGTDEPYGPSSQELVDKIRAKGKKADLLVLQDMDHAETVMALSDPQGKLVQGLLAMIKPGTSSRPSQ